MTLIEALLYSDTMLAKGHRSDGCTFSPDLGIKKFCIMHDMLRRFKPIPPKEADIIFKEGIKTKGFRYYPIAYLYYFIVVITRRLGVYR